MIFTAILPQHVAAVWGQAKGFIQQALDTYPISGRLEDILNEILRGSMHLWIVVEDDDEIIAAIVTRFVPYYDRRSLGVCLIGGKPHSMQEWLDMVDNTLRAFARDNNCEQMEGYGREAWGRVLSRIRFKKAYSVFTKDVADGR